MKKFRVTSPHYAGFINLVYDKGKLCLIDFQNAVLTAGQIRAFLSLAQANLTEITEWFKGTSARVVEVPLEATFDSFWIKYNRKINKARATKLWDAMNDADRLSAIIGIAKYNTYLNREQWRQKADPEKYLRGRYWENEY